MHIIKAVCKRRKITYEEFAKEVKTRSGKEFPGGPYIAQIVCGTIPSAELAADIEAAFPEIRREWLVWPERWQAEIGRFFPETTGNGKRASNG